MKRVYMEFSPEKTIKMHFVNDSTIREFCLKENASFQIDEYDIYVQAENKNSTGSISFYKDYDNKDILRIVSENCSLFVKSDIDLFLDYASIFIKKIKED